MNILMYGWEFPPKNKGGLGVACQGIVEGLLGHGLNVNLVLPYHETQIHSTQFEVKNAFEGAKKTDTVAAKLFKTHISSPIKPYQTSNEYQEWIEALPEERQMELKQFCSQNTKEKSNQTDKIYGDNLIEEVHRYGHHASEVAKKSNHDVIHAHDWMTYPAAIQAKKKSKKPLVLHIHATEFDRSGENPNPHVYQIEKLGFEHADKIIAVSELTKQKLVLHYQIDPEKIIVVHNAVTQEVQKFTEKNFKKAKQTVLFLGRMTMQKGPEYFIRAAKKVSKHLPDVQFLMVGDGDMMGQMIKLTHELKIEDKVIFTGFLKGSDVDRAFQIADLFVMPSVSEPFGLVALESIRNGTPLIMSKQSGASEVIQSALKVDFWDVNKMAHYILSALKYAPLRNDLRKNAHHDFKKLSWHNQSQKIHSVYQTLS